MLKHIKSHWLHVICSSPNPCQYRRILWLALQLDSSSSKSAASSLPRRSSRGMIAARRHGLNLGGHSGRSDAPTSARHMLTQCWQQREMHTGPPALYQLHAPHGPSHGMGWSTAEAAEAPPYTSGHASAGRLPRYAHAWGAGASWSRSLCMTACATGQAGTVHAEPTAAHSTRHTMPTAVNSQQHAQPFGTASSAGAAGGGGSATARPAAPRALQQVDYTTLCALAAEVAGSWVPAKVEQVGGSVKGRRMGAGQ